MRLRSRGDASGKADLAGSSGVGEDSAWLAKGIAGEGVVDDLRVVDAVASAEDGVARAEDVIDKAHARSEVEVSVGEGLALVAETEVDGESRAGTVVVLREDAEKLVVDSVVLVAEALLIVGDVVDVVEVGRAFADAGGLRACVIGELAQKNGTAELFTVAAVVGVDDTPADGDLMAAARNG